MTILFLLFLSLALVALIGAALVYAVNRVVAWTVHRVESRERGARTPATASERESVHSV